MSVRHAQAVWDGGLKQGKGRLTLGGRTAEMPYSFKTRFEEDKSGTNPEELIAAAHAGCFSMALTHILEEEGHTPEQVDTTAKVTLKAAPGGGFEIPTVELETNAKVPGLDDTEFQELADKAKRNCPVSKVLAGADITLKAKLLQ
ncbi:MAG: OsmC family protein [Planctomycetota bacterium]